MEEVQIKTRLGPVKGLVDGGVYQFLNVPYAQNNGRFEPCSKLEKWKEVRDCSYKGPMFPQNKGSLDGLLGDFEETTNQSEDAFNLNIWSNNYKKKRPVIVFIHGGGFVSGGASLPLYEGENLVKDQNIVYVTINYRLGIFGSLCLEGRENNLALKDLIQGLKWIKDNIDDYGGDSSKVTLCGQSAGAWYVLCLLACQQTKGLFNKACLLSLPSYINPLSKEKAEEITNDFIQRLKLVEGETIDNVSIERILKVQKQMENKSKNEPYFLPYADGEYLEEDLISQAVHNSNGKMSLMCGATSQETSIFMSSLSSLINFIPKGLIYKSLKDKTTLDKKTALAYYKEKAGSKSHFDLAVSFSTGVMFDNGIQRLANNYSNKGNSVYLYRFRYPSSLIKIKSCHCFDIPFFLNNLEQWRVTKLFQDINEKDFNYISSFCSSSLIEFAIKGYPNKEKWDKFCTIDRKIMVIDEEIELVKGTLLLIK